jgi:hypothetical protein
MRMSQLNGGEIYVRKLNNSYIIFRYSGSGTKHSGALYGKNTHNKTDYHKFAPTSTGLKGAGEISPATSEEKVWLLACIKKGKFVGRNSANSGFIVGKWYKFTAPSGDVYISRFKEIKDGNFCTDTDSFSDASEYPIEKLQAYLPEDHPDKIKKKVKIEVGKWYKYKNALCCFQGGVSGYGFSTSNKWGNAINISDYNLWELASDEEVESRLLEYAKKNYTSGTRCKSAINGITHVCNGSNYSVDTYNGFGLVVFNGGTSLFSKGVWAEIVKEAPKQELTGHIHEPSFMDAMIKAAEIRYEQYPMMIDNCYAEAVTDDLSEFQEEYQEEICEYCKLNIIEGLRVSAMYVCEGSHCAEAVEKFAEDSPELLEAFKNKQKKPTSDDKLLLSENKISKVTIDKEVDVNIYRKPLNF